jgi:hypothetical protein
VVGADRFTDLVAHGQHGVQRRHGILKDHGDVLAPDPAERGGCQPDELLTLEADGARDVGPVAEEAEQGHNRHALAGTRLADDAQNSPGRD